MAAISTDSRFLFIHVEQHVQGTLESWRSELDQCQLLFYRAASSNQTILFGGKNPPLERADGRLRSIPFPTRRATLKEVQRVCQCLATVEIIGKNPVKPSKTQ